MTMGDLQPALWALAVLIWVPIVRRLLTEGGKK